MNAGDAQMARALRGPVTLITVGVLFAVSNFTHYGFDRTWPVLLIVFGLLSLLSRGEGGYCAPPGPYSPGPYPPPPPPGPYDPVTGEYRGPQPQPGYEPPPARPAAPGNPARGGFGASAPQRPPAEGQNDAPGAAGGVS